MKFPYATIFVGAGLLFSYFYLSGGLLYLPDSSLNNLAAGAGNSPLGLVTHLLSHVGIIHLAGNLLPLLAFGFLLELFTSSADVLFVFFSSGVLASAFFSALNPGIALVGASSGVSGLIGASVAIRPKLALPLLLATPLFFNFAMLPLLSTASANQQATLFQQANELNHTFTELAHDQKSQEAAQVKTRLSQAEERKRVVEEGVRREAKTRADFFVHLLGVAFGVAYVFSFKKREFASGEREFFSAASKAKNFLRGLSGKAPEGEGRRASATRSKRWPKKWRPNSPRLKRKKY